MRRFFWDKESALAFIRKHFRYKVQKEKKRRGKWRKKYSISAPPEELRELPEDAELLKFIGFSSNEVGQFLQDMRKLGLRVDLKCMETEHNKDWSLKVLHKELMEEHAFMKGEQKE